MERKPRSLYNLTMPLAAVMAQETGVNPFMPKAKQTVLHGRCVKCNHNAEMHKHGCDKKGCPQKPTLTPLYDEVSKFAVPKDLPPADQTVIVQADAPVELTGALRDAGYAVLGESTNG